MEKLDGSYGFSETKVHPCVFLVIHCFIIIFLYFHGIFWVFPFSDTISILGWFISFGSIEVPAGKNRFCRNASVQMKSSQMLKSIFPVS